MNSTSRSIIFIGNVRGTPYQLIITGSLSSKEKKFISINEEYFNRGTCEFSFKQDLTIDQYKKYVEKITGKLDRKGKRKIPCKKGNIYSVSVNSLQKIFINLSEKYCDFAKILDDLKLKYDVFLDIDKCKNSIIANGLKISQYKSNRNYYIIIKENETLTFRIKKSNQVRNALNQYVKIFVKYKNKKDFFDLHSPAYKSIFEKKFGNTLFLIFSDLVNFKEFKIECPTPFLKEINEL